MKKIFVLFTLLLALGAVSNVSAQKFAYVDTEYILDLLPEYRSAQKQLDAMSEDWQKEMERKIQELEKAEKEFNAEQILMSDEMKKKRAEELKVKQNELRDFRNKKFGYEGELFKKRQELVKPIQDKVYDAVQKVAKARAYDFIFAKGGEVVMLYTNSKYDMSDEVLKELGIAIDKPTKNQLKPENPAPSTGGGRK
ncbi:MAG: OmpH family outer membrane protein [Bacteroidia bacterium]|nr:OmpH family outer membrane protein [Bacteroidia bacterium]